MIRLNTFEDIFNKLMIEYRGKKVEINTRQDGVNIASFITTIDNIQIQPLNKTQKDNRKKVGLIKIQNRKKTQKKTSINIPFILGFNTMNAVFLKNGVTIKTMNMEFIIKKIPSKWNKQLA
jgi:hypothetical protein